MKSLLIVGVLALVGCAASDDASGYLKHRELIVDDTPGGEPVVRELSLRVVTDSAAGARLVASGLTRSGRTRSTVIDIGSTEIHQLRDPLVIVDGENTTGYVLDLATGSVLVLRDSDRDGLPNGPLQVYASAAQLPSLLDAGGLLVIDGALAASDVSRAYDVRSLDNWHVVLHDRDGDGRADAASPKVFLGDTITMLPTLWSGAFDGVQYLVLEGVPGHRFEVRTGISAQSAGDTLGTGLAKRGTTPLGDLPNDGFAWVALSRPLRVGESIWLVDRTSGGIRTDLIAVVSPTPHLLWMGPDRGPAKGGTRVTITGQNLPPDPVVYVGEHLAQVLESSSTHIEFVTPARGESNSAVPMPERRELRLTTADGDNVPTSLRFWYLP